MKYFKKNSAWEKELLARFLDYAKTFSTSSAREADKGVQPSTECQRDFANKIARELEALGFEGVQVTEHAYVYAFVPANGAKKSAEGFCLLSHLDTVEDCPGKNVKPRVKKSADGGAIITSDGTTLLGADDKAGLSIIVTALHFLLKNKKIPHPKIELCFSPDEETGHGMDNVPLNLMTSKMAYTVDGGGLGEIEAECFNAYKSEVVFWGRAAHTGGAREAKMVNAISAASLFVQSLPKTECPETTDGRDGFFAPYEISGNMERAAVSLLLRDFESAGMERRKALVQRLAKAAADSSGARVRVRHAKQYANMKDGIKKAPAVMERLARACKESGVPVSLKAIRGGTDGARLTEMGIPCPNIWTGGHNFHSKEEWASLDEMLCAADTLVCLAALSAE